MFDVATFVRELAIIAVPVLAAITFHELAHGYVAYLLGDPTAKNAGRLTLNPLKHLDPLGTLVLVLTRMIGWAKPVPVDPRYFADPKRGMMLVSVAGPACNFLLAMVFALLYHVLIFSWGATGGQASMAMFKPLVLMCQAGVVINLALGIFNLLPIPPLDGSKILAGLLPPNAAHGLLRLERYGFVIILVLALTGMIGKIIFPAIRYIGGFLL
ncbi:MAG TPA: site-2 protease family protein [Desulfonatronum sp.]|nr:site-2 protease family protein [Desulfonatronum sp.]